MSASPVNTLFAELIAELEDAPRFDVELFLREHPDQTVLVHAVRRGTDAVELPLHALGPDPTLTTLVGAAATVASATLTLPGEAGVSVHEVG